MLQGTVLDTHPYVVSTHSSSACRFAKLIVPSCVCAAGVRRRVGPAARLLAPRGVPRIPDKPVQRRLWAHHNRRVQRCDKRRTSPRTKLCAINVLMIMVTMMMRCDVSMPCCPLGAPPAILTVRKVAQERWSERELPRLRALGRLADLDAGDEGRHQVVRYGQYGCDAHARLLLLDLEGTHFCVYS